VTAAHDGDASGAWRPSVRATELGRGAASAFLRRMGEPTWTSYARSAAITALLSRRRGALGIASRRIVYPWMFASARKPVVLEDVVIRGARKIYLGDRVMIEHGVTLDAKTTGDIGIKIGDEAIVRVGTLLDTGYDGSIRVGPRTGIGAYCEIRGLGGVEVGENCMLARNVLLGSGTHAFDDLDTPMTDQGTIGLPIVLSDDVWLGANVVVLGGVTIGRGAVVGANAVVLEDVPPGAIAAGVPARVVRQRCRGSRGIS